MFNLPTSEVKLVKSVFLSKSEVSTPAVMFLNLLQLHN